MHGFARNLLRVAPASCSGRGPGACKKEGVAWLGRGMCRRDDRAKCELVGWRQLHVGGVGGGRWVMWVVASLVELPFERSDYVLGIGRVVGSVLLNH